ncbi:MAG: tetratricopeptide repeat protein [Chitinophagales bacterium]|nr:tetratricopeptide repeat protein [Chitinophagales bacterium]
MKFLITLITISFFYSFISCKQNSTAPKIDADTLSNADLSDPQIKALTERIKNDPNASENYFLRSGVFLQSGNLKASFKDLSMAIALDSSNLKYYFGMADLALTSGSADAAVDAYNQILERDPQNEDAILKLSKVYFFQREYSSSLIQLSKAEEINKYNADIYFVRGLNLKEMGDTARAIASFQKAVSVNSDFYDAYVQLGLLHSNKPSQLAAQYFDNAIRIDSTSDEAYYDKAKFYQDRGDQFFDQNKDDLANENYKKAKDVYQELIEKNPQFENAYFNLGFIYVRQDSLDKAYRMFDFTIKVKPSYADAYYYRGLVSEDKGNKEQAASDFRKAISLKPDYELAKKELENITAK